MFALFDRTMLLAAGRIAFCGRSHHLVAYFATIDFPFPDKAYNPADYALELVIDKGGPNGTAEQAAILDAWQQRGPAVLQILAAGSDRQAVPRRRRSATPSPARGSHVALPVDALAGA